MHRHSQKTPGVRYEVALLVLDGGKDVDQVDVNLERLLGCEIGHKDTKAQRHKESRQ